MPTVFAVVNPLMNQAPGNFSPGAVEGRMFSHAVPWTPGGADVEWTFSLDGNEPKGLTVNPTTGVISGKILKLEDQGFSGSGRKYPEYDFREMKDYNIRSEAASYDFSFMIISTGTHVVGNTTVPFTVQAPVKITVFKDYGVEAALMMKSYLDGEGREPYTCIPKIPKTEEHCNALGGEWDGKYCSVTTVDDPMMISSRSECEALGFEWVKNSLSRRNTTSQKCVNFNITDKNVCEELGGTWDDNNNSCSGASISHQTTCNAHNGTWEEETTPPSGRDSFDDYKSSIKDAETLAIVNELLS